MKNTTIALLVILVAGTSGVFLYKKFAQVRTQDTSISALATTGSEVATSQATSISNINDIITISATSSLPITVATYGELPSPFIVKSDNSLFLVGLDKSVKQLISFDVPNPLLSLPLTEDNKYKDWIRIEAKLSPDRRWVVMDYGANKYTFGREKNGVGIIDLKDPELKLRVLAPAEVRMHSNFEFSPDGKFLGFESEDWNLYEPASLVIFNTATGDTVFESKKSAGGMVWVSPAEFSYISGGKIHVYSLATRSEQEILVENITAALPAFESFVGLSVTPEFSPDRRYVAYISASSTLTVFDTLTKRSIVLGGTAPREVDCCVYPSAQSLGFSKDSKSFRYKDHILNEVTENPHDGRYAEYEITLLDITNSLKKELNIVTPIAPSGYYKDYSSRFEIKPGSGDFLYVWKKEKVAPADNSSPEYVDYVYRSDYAITNGTGVRVCPNFPFEKFGGMELDIFAGKPIAITSVDIYNIVESSYLHSFIADTTSIVMKMVNLTTCSVLAEVSSKDQNLSLVY